MNGATIETEWMKTINQKISQLCERKQYVWDNRLTDKMLVSHPLCMNIAKWALVRQATPIIR